MIFEFQLHLCIQTAAFMHTVTHPSIFKNVVFVAAHGLCLRSAHPHPHHLTFQKPTNKQQVKYNVVWHDLQWQQIRYREYASCQHNELRNKTDLTKVIDQ